MISAETLNTLRQRHAYLGERIKAKRVVGWETQWDEREYKALGEAIKALAYAGIVYDPDHILGTQAESQTPP